jgi:hypothetical protein
MRATFNVASAFLALALAARTPAHASTYVVDDNGGAGVNFTSIAAAVAASVDGDVLVVRAGSYGAFVLDKALTIVADDGATVGPGSQITSIAAPQGARISGLDFADLKITACNGPVLCDRTDVLGSLSSLAANPVLQIQASVDVRFHRASIVGRNATIEGYPGWNAAGITGSRVEFSSCTITGGNGKKFQVYTDGGDGGDGIDCGAGSRVHFARTSVYGGNGAIGCHALCSGIDGEGGEAIYVADNATAIVAGSPSQQIIGGLPGDPNHWYPGEPSWGILVWTLGNLRYSGVTIASGDPSMPGINSVGGSGVGVTLAVPPDPTLELLGTPIAGAPLTMRLYATPGTSGRLQQGNQMQVIDDGLATIEKLDNRIRIHPLGPVPASGLIDYALSVPTNWQPGQFRVFQGLEIDPASALLLERTNSVPVVVH